MPQCECPLRNVHIVSMKKFDTEQTPPFFTNVVVVVVAVGIFCIFAIIVLCPRKREDHKDSGNVIIEFLTVVWSRFQTWTRRRSQLRSSVMSLVVGKDLLRGCLLTFASSVWQRVGSSHRTIDCLSCL